MKSRRNADATATGFVTRGILRDFAAGLGICAFYGIVSLVAILGFHAPAIPTIVVLGVITFLMSMAYMITMGMRGRRKVIEMRSQKTDGSRSAKSMDEPTNEEG